MVIKFYNIDSAFTPGEWYSFFYKEKKKNSKKTRLLSDCFQHFVLNYPFLDETQQWGKVYQFLGIPQICGKIDKAKLKKLFAVEKKENARLKKLKLQITQIKIRDNNHIDKKDSKLVKNDKQNARKLQNLIQETETAEILGKPNSVGNRKQLALKKKNINEGVGSVLDYVRKSEIQLKKRVRFKNVQVLCYDKSNSTESEISSSSLLINDNSEEVVNNNHEKAVHKPYFERLNDSLSSESNIDIEGNHAHLKTAPPIRLIEKEIDLALNKEKSLPENNKEMRTRDNHSKEGDIRNILDILGREQDNRVKSLCDQMYNKDYDNYSSSDNEIRIIPPFPTGYEDDNSQSSDSLINDHDTGVMSPSYPSDDESNHDIVIIRERDGMKDDNKLNNIKIKAKTSWEIGNSSGEELSEAGIKNTVESGNEPNAAHDEHQMQVESLVCSNLVQSEDDTSANRHLSVHSASGDRTSNMDYQFTDEIDIAEKNNADNEFSALKSQNYDQVKQKENNNNSGGIFEPNAAHDECQMQVESLVCSNLVQSEHDPSVNRHLSELEIQCDAISPLSSDSSEIGHLMHLTPSGKLLTAIGNIEKFRLSSSASFSLESSDIQHEFGFSTGTIYKSFVLDKDGKKELTFSSDSFNQNNTKEEARTKENNLISLSIQERLNSSDKMNRLNTKEELLNEHVEINMVEIEKENYISKKDYPTIISNSDATTVTGSSENTVPSSIIVEPRGKREPLKLLSNVRAKENHSKARNVTRNGNNNTDKENMSPEISDQTFPKKSISRKTPKKDIFFSESSSCELDKIVELMDLSSHDENRLRLSNTSIIKTPNKTGGKLSESDAGKKNSSLISEFGTHKKHNKLKKSTDENPVTDKSQITLPREANSPRETGGNDFAVQEIHFSRSSDELSETPDVLNNNEEYKLRENSNETPKVFFSKLENMINKNISLENNSKERNSEFTTRKCFSFKSPSTTINSSDSWSGKEYLLKNFNERASKIRKQDAPKKTLDDVRKTYFNVNKNFTKIKSRESTIRKVKSILNNSSQSSPELLDSDNEMHESNEYHSISDLSTQSVITDLGVKAYFNDPVIIPFDSSSDNSINLIPDYNSRSSTAAQRIKNLNLISPHVSSRHYNAHLNYDTGLSVKLLGSNEDAEMQEIDNNTRESITNMNISNLKEEEMETVKPLNQNKRKASSSSIRMTTGLNNDHDADSSSDGCIALSHKKNKRRRKKASRVAAKLKNHRRGGNNEDQLTSSDEMEIINEILMDQKREKRKLTGKKSTTTNTILINAINDLRNEKTTDNYQHSQKLSDDDNNKSSLDECDTSKEAIDSIGGQRITNKTLKLRKTSIVKQKINSSDTSTTSEFINSALARRIYYL
ncbi:uncharacterized protein [Rhodnius prolixus]